MKTMKELMTADQVAEYLQVPKATLYNWRYKGGGPPAGRVGRHLRYRKADVDRWFESLVDEGRKAS